MKYLHFVTCHLCLYRTWTDTLSSSWSFAVRLDAVRSSATRWQQLTDNRVEKEIILIWSLCFLRTALNAGPGTRLTHKRVASSIISSSQLSSLCGISNSGRTRGALWTMTPCDWCRLGPLQWCRYVNKQVAVKAGKDVQHRGWLLTVDPVSAR